MAKQDEELRLAALHELDLLDSEPEAEFDSITDLAVALTGAKMAAVSLVDRDRQWFKSNINIPAPETARDIAFCHHAIQAPELFHIRDALDDVRFATNPLVTGEPHIRGYAGIPIAEPGGYRIGTLCVIDNKPLELDDATRSRLIALGHLVEQIISQRAQAKLRDFSNRQLASIAQVQRQFINKRRSIDESYNGLLSAALALTGSKIGFIGEILEDEQGRYLSTKVISDIDWTPQLKRYFDEDMGGQLDFRLPDTLIGKVVETGEMLIANNAAAQALGKMPAGHPKVETFAAVPIYNRNQFIGALMLANRSEGYTSELFEGLEPMLGTMGYLIAEGRAERERVQLLAEQDRVSQRLLAVTELGGIGSWEVNMTTGQPHWDDITKRIHEVPLDYEPVMDEAINFYAPEARPIITKLVERGIELGEDWDVDLPFITAKGRRIWVRAVGRAIHENGAVTKLLGSFQDISERKAREDELITLTNRLELAMGASRLGVFEMNLAADTTWWDDGTRRIFRVAEDSEDPLEIWRSRLHPDDAPRLEERLAAALNDGADYDVSYRIVLDDGEIRHLRSQGVMRRNFEGEPIFSGVNLDLTDEVAIREEIEQRRKEADKANKAKSQFLANMSHEIRTPLNGVLGMAQLLRMSNLDDRQSSYVETLQNSGRALLDLIEDILDISKIEAGVLELASTPFDLARTVNSVVDMVSGLAREKDLAVTLEAEAALPDLVVGDEKRVRQVLINMAGNAVKFTAHGQVRIKLDTRDDDVIHFEVSDTGPGIPADQVGKIFGRFAQVDDSATRQHGGTGLGLAICEEIVSIAGGRIGVESEQGVGSTFWFEMPLPAATGAPGVTETVRPRKTARREAGEPGRILVVDDVATNQLVAKSLLQGAGHVVELAGNGREAIDALDAGEFDAVLMDIQMPVMSGDEAIRRIRASGRDYSAIPIFAVTADATRGAEEKYLASGADGYLVKPLDLPSVMAALDRVLRHAA